MTTEELNQFKAILNKSGPIVCKNSFQNYALRKHIEKNQRSTIYASPGSGKTKLGVVAACEVIKKYSGRALVSVPKENLIKQWNDEAVKWKYSKEWKSVDIICHASNDKYDPSKYEIVIIDEVHLAIKGEHHGSLLNHHYNNTRLLCLTGTKPKDKESLEKLHKVAPESFELTLNEAVELKLVSEYTINVIDIPFSGDELMKYKKAQQGFVYYTNLLGKFDAFEKAKTILDGSNFSPMDKRNATMLFTAIRNRKSIAQNAKQKLTVAKQLVDLFPEHYTITFSETNNFTTALHKLCGDRAVMFHSKMKESEKTDALKLFADRRTKKNIINSTKALSEGYNVPVINMGIVTAFTSKANTIIQRITRACRYIEGKRAILFILVVPNTQEEQWLKNALKDVSNVRYFDSFETYKSLL